MPTVWTTTATACEYGMRDRVVYCRTAFAYGPFAAARGWASVLMAWTTTAATACEYIGGTGRCAVAGRTAVLPYCTCGWTMYGCERPVSAAPTVDERCEQGTGLFLSSSRVLLHRTVSCVTVAQSERATDSAATVHHLCQAMLLCCGCRDVTPKAVPRPTCVLLHVLLPACQRRCRRPRMRRLQGDLRQRSVRRQRRRDLRHLPPGLPCGAFGMYCPATCGDVPRCTAMKLMREYVAQFCR